MRFTGRSHRIGLSLFLVVLAGYGPAAAQQPTPKPKVVPPAPKPKAHVATKPTNSAKPPKPEIPQSFKGIAVKLNTTPEALETQFEAARAANPKLTHGQFVAANILAQNLGATHPDITVQAILDGLKHDKSIGQTLQSLKLSPAEAKEAEEAADREAKAAEKGAKKPPEEAKKPKTPAEPLKSFVPIASGLNTTAEGLETQFMAARAVNPKLTRDQFITANVLAHNLGATHPAVTVQAILDGIKSDKSIVRTLQDLQFSPKEAKEAEEAADRWVKAAEKSAKRAEKP